ncbi:MAG TPA: hypothetical protein VJA65_00375 [bacterium]|nr:hypothetical protein [bacterium]
MKVSEDDILVATRDWFDDPQRALSLLSEFLSNNPMSTRAKLRLAEIFSSGYGDGYSGAERLYRDILRVEPDHVLALSHMGLLHGAPGSTVSLEESLRLLGLAAEISGETWALENLGNKAWESLEYERAEIAFSRLEALAKSRDQLRLARTAAASASNVRKRQKPDSLHYFVPESNTKP